MAPQGVSYSIIHASINYVNEWDPYDAITTYIVETLLKVLALT